MASSLPRAAAGGAAAGGRAAVAGRLLGPATILLNGAPVDLGRPQHYRLAACLLDANGNLVPRDRLIDLLWDDDEPRTAHELVWKLVTELRAALNGQHPGAGALIISSNGQLAAAVPEEQVDLHRFRRFVRQARALVAERDHAGAVGRYRAALREWGADAHQPVEPLAGLPGRWAAGLRHRLRGEYRAVLRGLAEAHLQLGQPDPALELLDYLKLADPLDEQGIELILRTLDCLGRPNEAASVYQEYREQLAGARGGKPSDQLRQLNAQIQQRRGLTRPPSSVAAPASGRPGAAAPRPVPQQLPREVPGFTGRAEQLSQVDALHGFGSAAGSAAPAPRVTVSAVSGLAGVGKTALALHWAHRVRGRFPDGQLYANLRGYDPAGPASVAELLQSFLDALGMPAEQIPPDVDSRAALFRSLLSERRVLLVLDNARDADQVRPLLPGSATAAVLVTSRSQLAGLAATDGADLVPLDLLPVDDAEQLLASRLGAQRCAAEPAAVRDIIDRCGRLPLALAIVAGRAAARPHFPLAAVAAELADSRGRLDALSTGDMATDLRAVLSWSYAALSAQAARMFRLLGLFPGPDVGAAAGASLAAVSLAGAQYSLAELAAGNLLTEPAPGRFGSHDLVRSYAAELAHRVDPAKQRQLATGRLLDHYLHTARAGSALLNPNREPIKLTEPLDGVITGTLSQQGEALDWFASEQQVLRNAVALADSAGFNSHTWQLAWSLTDFLDRCGQWQVWAAVWAAGLRASQRLGEPATVARAHRFLGAAADRLADAEGAEAHYRAAHQLYAHADDRPGHARVHLDLGWLYHRRGRHAEAVDHDEQALSLYRAVGHRAGQAAAQSQLGWHDAHAGDYKTAVQRCQEALGLYEQVADRAGLAATWNSLGYAHHRLGRPERAVLCYRQALQLYRELGNRYNVAATLAHLGNALQAGRQPGARAALREALELLEKLEHPDAELVGRGLQQLDATAGPRTAGNPAGLDGDPIPARLLVNAPPGTREAQVPATRRRRPPRLSDITSARGWPG